MTCPLSQVTTLVNTSSKGPSSKKKGRSKKAHVLAVSVEQATQNFLEKGEQIAKDSHDLKEELISAVEDVRKQGEFVGCSCRAMFVVLQLLYLSKAASIISKVSYLSLVSFKVLLLPYPKYFVWLSNFFNVFWKLLKIHTIKDLKIIEKKVYILHLVLFTGMSALKQLSLN